MTQIGVFKLIDPPPGQVEVIQQAVDAIDYPWWRTLRATWADPDGACLVKWDPQMQQGATGLFYGTRYEIHLGTRYAGWEKQVPFVFAHEAGHFVDRATFDRATKDAITEFLHDDPQTYRRDEEMQNGKVVEHAHVNEHNEDWSDRNKHYYLMLNEAYADLFVRAFAPAIWDGTAFAELRGGVRSMHPRFTHWSNDLDAVRRLTLERNMTVYDDVPADHTHAEAISRAAELGLMGGTSKRTFNPNGNLTRAQAAAVMVRLYDRLKGETPEPAPNE